MKTLQRPPTALLRARRSAAWILGRPRTLAAVFKALADPTRVAIVSRLALAVEKCCVCDLTAAFDLSQPTVSHHLRILRDAGLVESERRGTFAYYWLVPEAIERLRSVFRPAPARRLGEERAQRAAAARGRTRKKAQLPRCSRSTSPASSSTLMWWLTGRLGQTERLGEVAHTGLAARAAPG